MFQLLETQRIVEGKASLTLLRAPEHALLASLLAAGPVAKTGGREGIQGPAQT